MPPRGSYPVSMSRLRRRAGFLVLALMLLGIAVHAGSALASGACCAMPAPHGSSDREPPCRSVAPTSCCEAIAAGGVPSLPGAPIFATAAAAAPPLAAGPAPCALFAPPPPSAPARIALASVVLRL